MILPFGQGCQTLDLMFFLNKHGSSCLRPPQTGEPCHFVLDEYRSPPQMVLAFMQSAKSLLIVLLGGVDFLLYGNSCLLPGTAPPPPVTEFIP